MADLIINAGNITGASEFEVGYRLSGSGASFTLVTPNPTSFPVVVSSIANGIYEVQIRKRCTNGVWSAIANRTSAACQLPISFTAVRNASDFLITYTLAFGITIFDVEITAPNGSIQNIRRADGNSGSITLAISPFMNGEWRLRIRCVCDADSPNAVSDWSGYVDINVAADGACPFVTNPNITVDSTTVIVEATAPINQTNIVGYTLVLVNGATQNTYPCSSVSNPQWSVHGLTPTVTYTAYIVTNCNDGGMSAPYSIGTFTIL
jgi:hypothetical protein